MNPIERLRDKLRGRFPDLEAEIDRPADDAGPWQLDIRPGGGAPWIVVEWRPVLGFGISTPGVDDYGTKPDETYPDARAAYGRVSRLILSCGKTEPPGAVRLADLRHLRELSQAAVAGRAGIKQSAIARIEGRDDVLLSTLSRVVSAMGGRLSIRAVFPDGTARELSGQAWAPSPVLGERTAPTGHPARVPAGSASALGLTTGRIPKAYRRGPKPRRAGLAGGSSASGTPGESPPEGRDRAAVEGDLEAAIGQRRGASPEGRPSNS